MSKTIAILARTLSQTQTPFCRRLCCESAPSSLPRELASPPVIASHCTGSARRGNLGGVLRDATAEPFSSSLGTRCSQVDLCILCRPLFTSGIPHERSDIGISWLLVIARLGGVYSEPSLAPLLPRPRTATPVGGANGSRRRNLGEALASPSMGESRPQFGIPYEVNESGDLGEGESLDTCWLAAASHFDHSCL